MLILSLVVYPRLFRHLAFRTSIPLCEEPEESGDVLADLTGGLRREILSQPFLQRGSILVERMLIVHGLFGAWRVRPEIGLLTK